MKLDAAQHIYAFDAEENRHLHGVLEMYVLKLNAEKAHDLGRDLLPDERFHAASAFASVLRDVGVSEEYWYG